MATGFDWHPYRRLFDRVRAGASPDLQRELDRLGLAPFASDPVATLRPAPLMVVSMKPYGAPGKQYEAGWIERSRQPGLHRWYDGTRATGNFVGEADRLLDASLRALEIDLPPREIFNTYAYFFRAADGRQLKRFGLTTIDCSTFHRQFLATVRPRVILCIGNGPAPSALSLYLRILGEPPVTEIAVAPRTRVRYFRAGGRLVVAVPHLSYTRAATLLPAVLPLLEEVRTE